MREPVGSLMKSRNSSRIEQDNSARATILGVPTFTIGGVRLKIKDNIYDLTPEIHKALSSTGFTVKK